ncbi:hypothetical protein SDC9_92746 [bioreactor metagenome]|uniref:Uncharacterized protein n=1 Tax=bioreactor metagenome TaxID=1076179 RepID=A0A644ZYY4_9ZZZZ
MTDTAAGAAHCEGRTDDQRIPDFRREAKCLVDGVDDVALRNRLMQFRHQLTEQITVFGLLDGSQFRAKQLDLVLLQNAGFIQFHRHVQTGLAAQCRQ